MTGCVSCGTMSDAIWLCDAIVGIFMGAVAKCRKRICTDCKFSTTKNDYCLEHARAR